MCIAGFLLVAWINAVSLKSYDYPLLYFYIDGRMQVAVAQDGYICVGGRET